MTFRGSRAFIAFSGTVTAASLIAACSLLPEPHVVNLICRFRRFRGRREDVRLYDVGDMAKVSRRLTVTIDKCLFAADH